MNGAEVLIKSLEDIGTTHIFGYSGGAILPVFDAIGKSKLKLTVNANEQSCAFAAAGFSRATNKVGVAIVTSGPAITNTLTAVADAYGDSIPLIVISGQVPEHKIGTDAFQHIDVESIFKCAAKKVIVINKYNDIEQTIKEAHQIAKSGKPGPVVIDIPKDCQQMKASYRNLKIEENTKHQRMTDGDCKHFYELLSKAKKPLLYIGGGTNNASEEVREFNKRFKIPYVNTLMGKGVLPEDETYALGMLGMYGCPGANLGIQETDFFFAIGVRWDDRVAEKVGEFALQAKIAYIDINPEKVKEIKRERQPEFSFIGDAATAVDDLLRYAEKNDIKIDISAWQEEIVALKGSIKQKHNENGVIQQAEVMRALSKELNGSIITTGVGNHQMFAAQLLKMHEPKSFLSSGSFGTMGFGIPTAIGASMARPDKKVVVVDGDGSMRMNMGELHTIGVNQIPISIIVMNNYADGMVRHLQTELSNKQYTGTERGEVALYKIAESCGFVARRITSKDDLQKEVSLAYRSKVPYFLEVVTDKDEFVYPWIKPGTGYKDMQLGPHIEIIRK